MPAADARGRGRAEPGRRRPDRGARGELAGATTEPPAPEPGPGPPQEAPEVPAGPQGVPAHEVLRHLNLRARLDGQALHGLQGSLSSLREKSASLDIELTVRAHAKPEGYEPDVTVNVRNALETSLAAKGTGVRAAAGGADKAAVQAVLMKAQSAKPVIVV